MSDKTNICYVKGCKLCVNETCIANPLVIGKDCKCMSIQFDMEWFNSDLKEKVYNELPSTNGRGGATQVDGE